MGRLHHASQRNETDPGDRFDSPDPIERLLAQRIYVMERALVELRRRTVNAAARQNRLTRRVRVADQVAAELSQDASLARRNGDEEMARAILLRREEVLRRRETMSAELERAIGVARRVKIDLIRMQREVERARGRTEGAVDERRRDGNEGSDHERDGSESC